MVVHRARYADAARLGQCLQPRRDIDAVAEDVVVLDNDVAEIDADAERDTPILGQLGVAIHHRALDLGGAADRIHDTRKFHQQSVAGGLHDPAAVLDDLGVDELPAMSI